MVNINAWERDGGRGEEWMRGVMGRNNEREVMGGGWEAFGRSGKEKGTQGQR